VVPGVISAELSLHLDLHKEQVYQSAKRTNDSSPAIHRWAWQQTEMKSVKRTAEKIRRSDRYHSAVRFTDYKSFSLYPSSELLGYYHSSALRTDKLTFRAKPVHFNA
jgi:hypothetical protein